eukprot:CAMPEP_0182453240 /NCGR_PEP_ID=MMETSP1319-20130603/388_1 /TAXON_ID=172717 /ORGANISM="Bolidomonas pacifica, Strain RCC208" /LENGTH=263 /DNA_ID=CAMNT_0024651149 /DNA_START=486 /DNA_END=1274 /DNA_ORIENTATION=+
MNSDITAPFVRCSVPPPTSVGKDESLGVLPTPEALAVAKEREADLILISDGDVPVCKIVDYSKWRYMKEKKAKEVKKNSKSTEVKEVKMSYKIDVGDLDVRRRNALKFLKQGNRVKVSVQFKGREQTHVDLGFKLLDAFADAEGIKDWGVMDKPKREGRQVSAMMSVRPEMVKKEREREKGEERRRKREERASRSAAAAAAADDDGDGADSAKPDGAGTGDSAETRKDAKKDALTATLRGEDGDDVADVDVDVDEEMGKGGGD